MKNVKIHDYAEDGDTETFQVITGVTAQGCVISEREYAYQEEDTLDIKTGIEITMSVPMLDTEAAAFITLEELAEESKITADDLSLVDE